MSDKRHVAGHGDVHEWAFLHSLDRTTCVGQSQSRVAVGLRLEIALKRHFHPLAQRSFSSLDLVSVEVGFGVTIPERRLLRETHERRDDDVLQRP